MKIYGTIEKSEKQDDGTMMVYGYASSESVDVDGEVIKADAIKGAIPDYMKFANVREMHDAKKAAGTVIEMEVQDDGRTFIKTHIVDAEACKKVANNVYKGFSIGGKVTSRDEADKKIIKGIKLSEISLVDRPANPDSIFTFCKVDDSTDEAQVDDAKPEAKPVDAEKADKSKDKKAKDKKKADEKAEGDESKDDAEKDKAAGKTDDVKKGMYSVCTLASLLGSINYLQEDTAWEAEYEGDDSTVPAQLKAWLKQGGEILKAMVAEEVAEMVGVDDSDVADMLILADKAKDLMKAACDTVDAAKFIKGFDTLVSRRNDKLAKSGARNSAADQKHIDAIHSAALALGAACDTDKAAGSADDLQKRAKDIDTISKALADVDGEDVVSKVTALIDISETLAKRVTQLEAMPKPPKAIVKAVDKSTDDAKESGVKVEKTDTPTDAMKKVWGSGGVIV